MKKRLLFFLLLITISSLGYTQQISKEVTYVEEKEIIYRVGNDLDDYMRERCKLDVYYPKNNDGFSTIIWFHGGGLRAGNKFIPETLKKQGIAIVAVNYRFHQK